MDYNVRVVEGTYGCVVGSRGELNIHIISRMMCIITTDGIIARIANIRHGIMNEEECLAGGRPLAQVCRSESRSRPRLFNLQICFLAYYVDSEFLRLSGVDRLG